MNDNALLDAQALTDARLSATEPSRRTALKVAASVGFAASVRPVTAQTVVTTPSEGLLAGRVTIDVNGYAMPAYRSAPAGAKDAPVVLVLPEIFGVHEHIADVTRRLAQWGYLAIAPDLMARQGDASSFSDMGQLMAQVVSKVPDAQVMADLDATVAWAARNGGDITRLAITGFCWGGRITWLYAAHQPSVKAAVAWYGRLVGQSTALTPVHPVEVVGQLKAPVLGLYGGADTGIPLDSVEAMKTALAGGSAAAKASQFVVYPDTPHAFHADYRPSYRKEAAQDGWKRLSQWFKANGV